MNVTYQIHPQVVRKKNTTAKSLFMSTLSMVALRMEDAVLYECLAMIMMKGSGRPLAPPTIKSYNLSIYGEQYFPFSILIVYSLLPFG